MAKLIKMLVSMAGAEENYSYGDLLMVSDTIADAWVDAKIAEIHVEQPQKVKEYVPDVTPYVSPYKDANPPDAEPEPAADPLPEVAAAVEPEPEPAPKSTKRRR